jgi:ubiquinone/menaquinone biosynthesis C-methylase UbiE
MDKNEDKRFWHIRSENYDRLYWVKNQDFMKAIIKAGELKKNNIVLDVGTGTGTVAQEVKKYVDHVVAIDISHSMLKAGNWEGISLIKWDINDLLFANNIFDKVFARMVFHHIQDDLDKALIRCYDLLKDKGKIIIAEGIPPSDNQEIVDWYSNMFKLKEKRRTFKSNDLSFFLEKNGFKNIKTEVFYMENFNINNWLSNSGLSKKKQKEILTLHTSANEKIKKAYNMRQVNGECIVKTINLIVTAEK